MTLHFDDLKAIAQAKLHDAALLQSHGRHSNAYYLFGYSVEIGLKAVIAKGFLAGVIPDRTFVQKIHTHDLDQLIGLAGLKEKLDARRARSALFDQHWIVVSGWSESARYDIVDEFTAATMAEAMLSEEEGIFGWLQSNW